MSIDPDLLREQCARTLEHSDFPALGVKHEGKVRDSYVRDGRRTIVVTDRVSAFDVVLGTIPFKGQVLNQIAAFWFDRTGDVAPNHVLSVPDPNVTVGRECRLVPIEFVVRGHLTGVTNTSIWTAYDRGERVYCGHRLPEGLRRHERLPEPLLTPTTKAEAGAHDELTSRAALIEQGVVSAEFYDRAEAMVLRLFAAGQQWAEKQGLILVDTKYELGFAPGDDGTERLVVIDEIHTPDSSRYWYRDSYERALSAGTDPKAMDKEYVRRWLAERGYTGDGTPPALPDEVRCEAARRYIETFERITGERFAPDLEAPIPRIRRHLGI
ncbi:phosphoribosylaminoimidazolesuccinocarboxamide synthase [Myxococcota bacterium]|nr:phosphoribosylaminoimidazolesuccinocarboxamide synthase [Myxococcota bacterium]MCZ7618664.1 phosphoribosylaminoimidazolesuccinocarboxamide synthase [Myxococcota bacterium]